MPVQWVNRPHLDFRGYAGTIASGSVRIGDEVLVAGSQRTARVARIVTAAGDLESAQSGAAVTLVLDTELDIARGDVLADPARPPQVADQFTAHLIWMHESELLPGRSYLMKIGAHQTTATVTALKHQLDVNTLVEACGQNAVAEPGRLLQSVDRGADRVRPVLRKTARWAASSSSIAIPARPSRRA